MVKILYWYLKNFTGRELGRTNGSKDLIMMVWKG